MRIAIEVAGDHGYEPIVRGAKEARREKKGLEIVLVAERGMIPENCDLEGMDLVTTDSTFSYSNKILRGTSIEKAIEIHKNKEAEGVVAIGDTAGAVFYSRRVLKRIRGVLKPAIALQSPYKKVLLDMGASPNCNPEDLYQFAIMGKIFSEVYLGAKNPSVGILSNGPEIGKGNELAQKSRRLILGLDGRDKKVKKGLDDFGYNVQGFVEPYEFIDLNKELVAVSDGFTWNVSLKLMEAILRVTKDQVKLALEPLYMKPIYPIVPLIFRHMKRNFSPEKYGTAPLLGVNGNVMICHGASSSEAVKNALLNAPRYIQNDLNLLIEQEILRCSED